MASASPSRARSGSRSEARTGRGASGQATAARKPASDSRELRDASDRRRHQRADDDRALANWLTMPRAARSASVDVAEHDDEPLRLHAGERVEAVVAGRALHRLGDRLRVAARARAR